MRYAFIAICCLLLVSCADKKPEQTKLDKLNWLTGFWEMAMPEGKVTESWVKTSDSSYNGEGKFMDSLGRVMSTEQIQIVLRKSQLYYIPAVSNQNNGEPITFKELTVNDTMIVFENKGHDFPQRIAYIRKSVTEVAAYIEGEVNGQLEHMDFSYRKK